MPLKKPVSKKSLSFNATQKMSEFKLHLAIKKHYDSCFIGAHNPSLKIMHIANEQRNAQQGYWNKVLGVEKGFVDLLAGWPNNTGVMEIKLTGKKLTNEQNRFLSWAHHIGWHTGIARKVEDAHIIFRKWGLNAAYLYNCSQEPDYSSKEQKFGAAFDFYKP